MLFVTETVPSIHPRKGTPHNIAVDTFQKAAEETCPVLVFKSID